MSRKNRELVNEIMANPHVMKNRNFCYFFFQISGDEYEKIDCIDIEIEVHSGQSELVLNGYLPDPFKTITGAGRQRISIPVTQLERGENILAYKGQIEIVSIDLQGDGENGLPMLEHVSGSTDDYGRALEFLLNSQITAPVSSQFAGSAYCIYDYTNGCYRMPCWLWSDAPVVSVLLDTIRSGRYPEYQEQMEYLARGICEVFLNTQILDEQEESYGAYVSRYRYYSHQDYSFNRLLGPNDTSFSIKWAILPMYEYTADERYLRSARLGLEWVEKVIRMMDFVPSHYYFEDKKWEDRAFVDTGFCVEGFQKYDEITKSDRYTELIDFTMKRYIRQFKLDNGFFGQNYRPEKGVDSNLFARGQGWALEGLLACIKEGVNKEEYLAQAESLADLIVANQNVSGSFSWSMGDYDPSTQMKQDTGDCEKGTAVLAWLLMELYLFLKKESYLVCAKKAIDWCSNHIKTDVREGVGGIAAAGICSGITGLPFLEVATGYANAFYLMALKLWQTRVNSKEEEK